MVKLDWEVIEMVYWVGVMFFCEIVLYYGISEGVICKCVKCDDWFCDFNVRIQ